MCFLPHNPNMLQKLLLVATLFFGNCLSQHPILLGTMQNIPAKIHYEIFGGGAGGFPPVIDLSKVNLRPYLPLLAPKHGGLTYNSIAYGIGRYQTPLSNNTKSVDRIPLATELFAPAIVKYPAATKGQMEAYMKALEEEAKEAAKEMEMMNGGNMKMVDGLQQQNNMDSKAVSYVNVKLGGTQNVNYEYMTI